MTVAAPPFDQAKFDAALGKLLGDVGAALGAALVITGEKLGLYKALAQYGPLTAEGLAERTQTNERYIREWLSAQAAAGYVEYDAAQQTFTLPVEHVPLLADDESEVSMGRMFAMAQVLMADEPRITQAFRTGEGVGWHEHDERLFGCTERLFRPGYRAHLVNEWIPALDGVAAKLQAGAKVADVGCGHGTSTIVLAKAFPNSTFVGYDYHEGSIQAARAAAKEADVADRVAFEIASAHDFPARGFDLIAFFDCVHDMGDPVGALAHARSALAPGGTIVMVEPFAGGSLEANCNPVGRVFYSASTMLCTPASRSQNVGLALGAQCGEAKMRAVAQEAGLSSFRRAAQTPFNLIYEVRA